MNTTIALAAAAPALGGVASILLRDRTARAAIAGSTATAIVGVLALAGLAGTGIDSVGGLLLILVGGVTAVVQRYASRQLRGAPGATMTLGLLGVAAAASAIFVTATDLLTMAAAWTVTGAAFLGVLAAHRELPSGRAALRRAATAFAIADGALWAAVILHANGADAGTASGHAVALLLVVAAAARAAQLPLHGWLLTTIAAPAPVCAFLHAGIVNAGGILLLRQQDLFVASTPAMVAAIVIGSITMVAAALAMAARTDVKGALACSTSAQMGFMLVTCGLGIWAATIIHIVGHGMYKAAGFLGASSAIAERAKRRTSPDAPEHRVGPARQLTVALGAPAAGLAATAATLGSVDKPVLLFFAWVTAAAALWAGLRRTRGLPEQIAAGALGAGAAGAYLLAAEGLGATLALPGTGGHPVAWLVLIPVAMATAAIAAWHAGGTARDRIYMVALRISTPRPVFAPHMRPSVEPAPRPARNTNPRAAVAGGGTA